MFFQSELPQISGVSLFTNLKDDVSWLIIHRQIIPEPPELPDNLKDWLEVFTDPDKEPQIIEQRQIDGNNVSFYEDEPRQNAYIEGRWLRHEGQLIEYLGRRRFGGYCAQDFKQFQSIGETWKEWEEINE